MTITKEQFIRGFTAIRNHLKGAQSLREAAEAVGWRDLDVADEGLCDELAQQLRERCGDDANRPVGNSNSLIEYALWDAEGEEDTGDGWFDLRLPEEVWRFWEQTLTGPFSVGAQTAHFDPAHPPETQQSRAPDIGAELGGHRP